LVECVYSRKNGYLKNGQNNQKEKGAEVEKLVQGLHQFQANYFRPHREIFKELVKGQHPESLIIACSDSRVSPTLLTQSKPGDVFVLRNAGNIVPPYGASQGGEAATIEYAVAALGVKEIIVCGHTLCGAMKALMHPEDAAELPAVRSWLGHAEATRAIIKENYSHLEGEARHKAAIEENVLVQLENLRTHPAVAAKLACRELTLHGWVYKMETGQVFSYDVEQGQFLPLTPAVETGPLTTPAESAAG
jgi:carbonic anhydrase